MAERGGARKDEDTEEMLQQKFRTKCLFRAFVRRVMANAYWLIDASEQYEGLDDVKRRVEQALRSKGKKKQLLSINDKSLLNKPAEDRTDQEKKYLYRIIGGLKCFKRYPNHVKRKLAAVTYFKYYGPGRTIVRQHHEAHALYFIVTGDVVVSQMIFDELLQQYVSVEVGNMHSGDMFGEVSLLHNIPRTATVTTLGHCELLELMKEDFKNILQVSVQNQWDEVQRAMSAFTYFDTLDEVARREGCIVAKLKTYEPNETLLGDGVGVANFVYFVLSGKCQMIESMQVIVTTRLGRNYYTLYDPCTQKEPSVEDIARKYFTNLKNNDKEGQLSKTVSEHDLSGQKNDADSGIDSSRNTVSEGIKCASKQRKRSSSFKTEGLHVSLSTVETNEGICSPGSENIKSKELLRPTEAHFRDSMRLSLASDVPQVPQGNLRTYFMQVCQLNPGSSFGFGENMRDRRIVALTRMSCMLLPKVWLLQRNSANIWTRIQHYLEKKILTKEQLFEMFVSARRWTEYREQIVSDVVARSKTVNSTTIHDVPYSIRMEEMLDL